MNSVAKDERECNHSGLVANGCPPTLLCLISTVMGCVASCVGRQLLRVAIVAFLVFSPSPSCLHVAFVSVQETRCIVNMWWGFW
jgi:hypothetical protein